MGDVLVDPCVSVHLSRFTRGIIFVMNLFVVILQLPRSFNQLLGILNYELKEVLIIRVIDIGICGIINYNIHDVKLVWFW